jgi:hypothetical protein
LPRSAIRFARRPRRLAAAALGLALGLALGCSETDEDSLPETERAQLEALGYLDWGKDTALDAPRGVSVHDPARSSPGYGLFTMPVLRRADLIDAEGRILRSWEDPDVQRWERATLCSNGDLVVVQRPLALARFDWEGKLLWRSPVPAHHIVVSASEGRLVTITDRRRAVAGLPVAEILDNGIALLAAGGELLGERSLWDMLAARPDLARVTLPDEAVVEEGEAGRGRPAGPPDVFHANFLDWIRAGRPGASEPFSPGRVLATIRHQDVVALFDWERGEAVWAWGQGELQHPHDASLTAAGTLLVFDNRPGDGWSRVVEVDPRTREIVWQWRAPTPSDFFSASRGCAQRLPNGNTLISASNQARAFEVTRAGEIVWDFHNPHRDRKGRPPVLRMVRYAEAMVRPLLDGAPRGPSDGALCEWR